MSVEPLPQEESLSYELLLRKSLDVEASPTSGSDDATSTIAPVSSAASSAGASSTVAVPDRGSVQLLRNVPVHNPTDSLMAGLIDQTRALSEAEFHEDCTKEITKKAGWKLSMLASGDLSVLCGFVVSKVTNGSLSIAKIAVPAGFRGLGFGRYIMDELMKAAKKQGDVYDVCLSSLPTAMSFYQRLGFKAFKNLKLRSDEELVEGQVYMEKRLRPRPRR
mmetsp:Transcript_14886/g.42225  ORF Transcript_14886/g.42225 Transcript_14886/m.42225 type:complete len:220 (-) Transcript_14886:215-874(-)